MRDACALFGVVLASLGCYLLEAQPATSLSATTKLFVKADAPVIALTYVKVIDGTGAGSAAEQTIVIDHGRIQAPGWSVSAF
jgi:enamidase